MIAITCTGTDTIELYQLTNFQGKLKSRTDADIDKIIKSIRKHGFSFPFFVWRTTDGVGETINYVLDGHGRLEALNKMARDGEQIPALPCVYIEAESEAEAKEKLLKLNSHYGTMTAESVAEFLDGIEIDFDEIALPDGLLDLSTLNEEETETEGDDDAGEVQDGEPDSKLGEMYELGNSILMCGDSTDAESVARLMGGEKADLVFTDPPYNLETTGGCKGMVGESLSKQGKEIDFISDFDPSQFLEVLPSVFNGNMNAYIFCNKNLLPDYLNYAKEKGYSFNVLVWKKPSAIPIGDSHRPDIEYLVLFRKNAIWNNGLKDVNYSRCLEFSRVKKTEENGKHPTIKPVELIENEIKISSKEKSIVVDLFGGSGSTLIACEKSNRHARVMELDPKYCDVIRRRFTKWAKQNGRPITSGCLE